MKHQPTLAGVSSQAIDCCLPAPVSGGNFSHSYNEVLTPPTSLTSEIKDRVLTKLKLQLQSYGQSPSPFQWAGLSDVIDTLTAMLCGTCPPKVHLSSLDPGMGKTTALTQFLKEVVRSSDHADVGVVVFLSRKAEIERLVEEANLRPDDFAVYTADDECNAISPTPVNDAQVLFTTQQMLTSRCKGGSFEQCSAFYYLHRVRDVRVWDETLEPSEVVTLSSDDLGELLPYLRRMAVTTADQVQDLLGKTVSAPSGSVITIPAFEGLTGLRVSSDHGGSLRRNLDALAAMSGRPVRILPGQGKQKVALYTRDALPTDMAPLLVLDASGRVRETYNCWNRHRTGLVRLRSAPKDYSALTVHVLDQGSGKDSWTKNDDRLAVEIATVIDSKPDEPWLVVCHKDFVSISIPKLILEHVTTARDRVQFVTWGQHTATNAFADISNVVIASTYCLPDWQYSGLAYACSRRPINQELSHSAVGAIRLGEHGHNIYQALCRASVRGNDGGRCKPCTAYVIAAKASGIRDKLADWFPGCQVTAWSPSRRRLQGQKKKAVLDYIATRRAEDPDAVILFKEVQEAVGISDRKQLTKIRKCEHFRAELTELGLQEHMIGNRQGANAFIRFFHPTQGGA